MLGTTNTRPGKYQRERRDGDGVHTTDLLEIRIVVRKNESHNEDSTDEEQYDTPDSSIHCTR